MRPESLNFSLRKIIKNRALFPNDEAVCKILYLALRGHCEKMDNADPELERNDESIYDFI